MTALLESMLWAVHTLAAAFLRRSSKRLSPNTSDPLIALTSAERKLRPRSQNQAFGRWASKTQQQRTGTLAPQNDYERVFTYDGCNC